MSTSLVWFKISKKKHFKSFLCADYIKTIILTTLQDFTVSYRAKSEKMSIIFVIIKIKVRLTPYHKTNAVQVHSNNTPMID